MVLKELGCATDHAEDGAEALEHLMMDSEMYSLVLMDLRMPVMDGFDATLAIRKMGIDLPVIAVTADETFDTRRR
jgi:CheY-like chemotaxis protein